MSESKSLKCHVESSSDGQRMGKLWCLRMLVRLGAVRKLLHGLEMDSDLLRELLEVFKLPKLLDACERAESFDEENLETGEEPPSKYLARELPRALRRALRQCATSKPGRQTLIEHNLAVLVGLLGLNAAERELVHFALLVTQLGWLRQVAESLGSMSYSVLVAKLAVILDLDTPAIRAALSTEGALARSGLLRVDTRRSGTFDMADRLEPLEGLMEMLSAEHADTLGLFQGYFRRAGAAELTEADFDGCAEDYALIREYLGAVRRDGKPGINLLIHGRPGVGKTQLVRRIAESLGSSLYEVATMDGADDTLNGTQRLRAYALSERVLARNPDALILFDEAEDVFGNDQPFFPFFSTKPGGQTKAAINRLLEENTVPTVWLTNSVAGIDPAYVRRFRYVLELQGGTRATRRRNFAKQLEGTPVSAGCIEALADQETLAPAVVTNAAALVRTLGVQESARADRIVRRAVENTLQAMGELRRPIAIAEPPTVYSLRYANPDVDLAALMGGLRARPQARLCLYGPPGTGKTAFAHHLAQALDKPLTIKRASDLLSMWVGGSEQNIAGMFRDAAREQALLLLDEADSLLRDRTGAHQSWEITQVNEVLTQMEAFEGIFVASTNLVDTLDAASLRRFDFKIRFNYLNPLQAQELFASVLGELAEGAMTPEIEKRLNRLGTLATGDFAVVVRKARVFGVAPDAARLVQGLEDECRMKERGASQPIGFTAALG